MAIPFYTFLFSFLFLKAYFYSHIHHRSYSPSHFKNSDHYFDSFFVFIYLFSREDAFSSFIFLTILRSSQSFHLIVLMIFLSSSSAFWAPVHPSCPWTKKKILTFLSFIILLQTINLLFTHPCTIAPFF